MITVTTDDGTYTGSSIVSIVHREYGPNAQPMRSPNPDSPHYGVVAVSEQCGTEVVAKILRVQED